MHGALVQLVRIHACHAWGHGFESRTHRRKKGGLAQLARASALHAEGQRFESVILHRVELMLEKEKGKTIFNSPFSIFNSERSLTCCTFSKVTKKSKLSKYQSGA